MRRLVLVLGAILAGTTASTISAAASKRKTDFPCPGCLTDLPEPVDAQKKVPLLVLLHGDGAGPLEVAPLFAKEAAARGIVLFVPKCPKADGCTTAQWWAWGKDPAWFDPQIAAIEAVQPLDHDRLWLAGWSGGGSYIGRLAPSLAGRFAAASINGGGMPPASPSCPRSCKLPAYFLVGDKNPLHALAKDLRGWFEGCGQEVVWDLLPGKAHDGERLEISKPAKVAMIVDWLEKHPKSCLAAAGAGTETETETEAETEAETETETEAEAETEAETEAGAGPHGVPAAPTPAATPGRCGCGVGREGASTAALVGGAWVVAALLRRRLKEARRD